MVRLLQVLAVFLALACGPGPAAEARDLAEIRAEGVLRHLGIPYARFITGSGDGLDVELMQRFARHLGVRYEFVETSWSAVFADLTGKAFRGDVIASGLTVLPDRTRIIDYGTATFPSAVWLVARADTEVAPIPGSGDLDQDIALTKTRLANRSTLVVDNTCLDPKLYGLDGRGLDLRHFPSREAPIELVPALLRGDADMTLLDVADTFIALEKWPTRIKVVGPISGPQTMAPAFRKSSPQLRAAFNAFFAQSLADGSYQQLVRKYYPAIPRHYPDFFGPEKQQGYVR